MNEWSSGAFTVYRVIEGHCNVFLVLSGGLRVLVDTSRKNSYNRLKTALDDLGVDSIDYLLLTHTHFDHAGNAARIQKDYRAKVIVHQSEAGLLRQGWTAVPRGTNTLTKFLSYGGNLLRVGIMKYPPCEPDICLDIRGDAEYMIGGLRIIHTPGHTEGSVSLLAGDIALVGDATFGMIRNSILPLFANDETTLRQSWRKLLNTRCRYFHSGHGDCHTYEQIRDYVARDTK